MIQVTKWLHKSQMDWLKKEEQDLKHKNFTTGIRTRPKTFKNGDGKDVDGYALFRSK